MQQNQDQNQPSSPSQPPVEPASSPKGQRRLLIGLAAGIVLILILVVALLGPLFNRSPSSDKSEESTKPLTVGSQPYLYPCSTVTRDDYARIFGLDDEKVGTVTETSALALKDIKGGGDLEKLAPSSSSSPSFATACSYTLAKKGATQVNRLDVTLTQFASKEEAADSFKTARSVASGDFTDDAVDNGKRQLSALPSFSSEGFIKMPEANFDAEQATFIVGTRMVKLDYSFIRGDTAESITLLLDSLAQAVKTRIETTKVSTPTDLTGHDTFVGKKFVDLCRQTELAKLKSTLSNIELRPDEASSINSYGSLEGSRAANDGAGSTCTLSFNTSADREAQAAIKKPESSRDDPLSSSERWPHKVSVSVNTFKSSAEAMAALAAKKERVAKPFNQVAPTITDMKNIGDAAHKYHSERSNMTSHDGEDRESIFIEDALVVATGSDVITVYLQQNSVDRSYKTAPLAVKDEQLKEVYQLVASTISNHRK